MSFLLSRCTAFVLTSATILQLMQGETRAAAEVTWGNGPSGASDRVYDSLAAPADQNSADYTFAVGTFGGLIPTSDNTDQWFGSWKELDRATLVPATDQFLDIFSLTSNSTAAAGESAYIFVYRTQGEFVTEASLFRSSSWIIPNLVTSPISKESWMLDDVDELVFGGVRSVSGPGTATVAGIFDVQTHGLPVPIPVNIPEPSASLSLLAAACLWATRRRRSSRRLFQV